MPGATSTMIYNNAALDNWLMTLGGGQGFRWISGIITAETSGATLTRCGGGISAYVQRTATGLYTLIWELTFQDMPVISVNCYSSTYIWQAHVYQATTAGCKILTEIYSGGVWALSDLVNFSIFAFGR